MKIENLKTKLTLVVLTALISLRAAAQNAFAQALDTAGTEIAGVFDSLSKLMLVVGGVVGVVGAIRIYIKWNNGDQDVTKSIVGWGGAGLFLVATSAVLRAIFL